MGVGECEGCEECGTTFDESPSHHRAPAPHEWREGWRIDSQTGETWKERVCLGCYKRERIPPAA